MDEHQDDANAEEIDPVEELKETFPELNKSMRGLIANVGFANVMGDDPEEQEIWDLAKSGHCMTCRANLGPTTNFIVNTYGIVAAYCCGPCTSDMAVLGWIGEQHDDIISLIKFRGNPKADEADDPES